MANDWDPHVASIAQDVTPDWEVAADFIERLNVEQLEELLEEADLSPQIDQAAQADLPAAREILRADLTEFRTAAEHGHPHLVRFWTRDIYVYVVDDRKHSALWDGMPRLRWSRVLVAAGFDDTR
jgi:hypothetical protein